MTPAERKVVEQAIVGLIEGRKRPPGRDWWTWRDSAEQHDRVALATINRLQTLLSLATKEPEGHP